MVNRLQINESERVFVPNEIFIDFKRCQKFKAVKHMSFAYCYYILISYLYRYCKYDLSERIAPKDIKELAGYSPLNKQVDYIIKKNGLLDEIGYSETTRDFPVSWSVDGSWVDFNTYSDMSDDHKKILNIPSNFRIKKPVKGFHRTDESKIHNINDGTFYEIGNTHEICLKEMLYISSKFEYGSVYFYLYQFFKIKNKQHPGHYYKNEEKLAQETGIPRTTLAIYLKKMKDNKILSIDYQYGRAYMRPEERIPNGYKTIDIKV